MTEDIWARWLSFRRQGSTALSEDQERQLQTLRDRVLGLALIAPDDTVLDVGCGDGLIAFGALPRLGSKGRLIFADISADLLTRCKQTALHLDVADRCAFIVCPADDLRDVASSSVDVVTTRSVLIYVAGKHRALAEFYRVLRPGGRAVIAEPINRYSFPEPAGTFLGYDIRPVEAITAKLTRLYDQEETPAIAPMLDFDERDLVNIAERAGFTQIHLDLQIDVQASPKAEWEPFLRRAGNPLSPTMEEAMDRALTPAEREQLTAYLRPLVENGNGISRRAFAFMAALK